MKTLVFAYACEPEKGSEPGAGWSWAQIISTTGDTWVVTRSNNRAMIEAHLSDLAEADRIHFVYVDLPAWARRWKRGRRGIHLYYLLWQVAAWRTGRRLDKQEHFDLTWHVTLSQAWMGTTAALLRPPLVYGPVGGCVGICWPLLAELGPRGIAYEVSAAGARRVGRHANPLAWLTWRRARLILAQNPETRDWFPSRHQSKVEIFPNVVIDSVPGDELDRRPDRPPTALYAGNLLAFKGVALAIQAMALLPEWRLLICGAGPDEARLRRTVDRVGARERVEFLGQLPRDELFELMRREADVFVFPSLHEGAPWVVVEALTCGLPVVCLDRGGGPVLGGTAVSARGPAATVRSIARTLEAQLGAEVRVPEYDLTTRAAALGALLDERGLGRGRALVGQVEGLGPRSER